MKKMYGFPTIAATQEITPGQAVTITADAFTVQVPADAFTSTVTFNLLTADPTTFKSNTPAGEDPILAFAFNVKDSQTGEFIAKFNKPVMLIAKSPQIVAASMYYNVATDGTFTANPTGMQVKDGELDHPVAGAGVGWVITAPASGAAATPTAVVTSTLRTPAEAALAAAGGKKIGGTVTVLGVWGGSEQDSFMAMIKPFEDATGINVQYTGTRDLNAVLTTRVQGGNPPDLAGLPGPGQMAQYAQQGKLVDLSKVLDLATYDKQYAKTWNNLGTVNGTLVGIFIKASVKG